MRNIFIITLILLTITGCSNKDIKILKYMQKTDYLVENIKPLHVEFEKYQSRYFMPWNIKQILW